MKVTEIPIIIDALCTVIKGLVQGLEMMTSLLFRRVRAKLKKMYGTSLDTFGTKLFFLTKQNHASATTFSTQQTFLVS